MSPVSYPPAPWFTHGHAFVAPYVVRVADLLANPTEEVDE